MTVRAVLFDLFGTVVHFAPQVPTVPVAGTARRVTLGWLREVAAAELPETAFEEVVAAVASVTEESVRQRPPEFLEVSSGERFRRALRRLGVDAGAAPAMAERWSRIHMAHLASLTHLPADHGAVLAALAARYRLGLVSNFDHAETARQILATHGVLNCFDPILISDEFGRRKPHPAIFQAALRRLELDATQVVFVGDSVADDVIGAHNAGMECIWVNPHAAPLPAGAPRPRHEIQALYDLEALLRP